jgi:hypothetical protein
MTKPELWRRGALAAILLLFWEKMAVPGLAIFVLFLSVDLCKNSSAFLHGEASSGRRVTR